MNVWSGLVWLLCKLKARKDLKSLRATGAEGGTRTRTSKLATPSRWCVYQIPPLRHFVYHRERSAEEPQPKVPKVN